MLIRSVTRSRPIWLPPLLVIMVMMAAVSYVGGHVSRRPGGLGLILVLTGAIALLFRLRHPVPVTVVTVLTGAALPLTAPHLVLVDVATIVALYTLATVRERRVARTAGVFAAVALTAAIIPWQRGGLLDLANLVPANYVALAVAAGEATRNRRALLAEVRVSAVREERVRIARDLHDVVAHHIALVNAQAGVAHHLMAAHPDRAREALAGIRDTSRTALDELRATVGLLRQEGDPPQGLRPAPAFAALDDLIEGFRKADFTVRLSRTGVPAPLAGAADLAAYRIVQESLTNANKHGIGRRADVTLEYTAAGLRITVTNPAHPARRGAGTGHGLIGMRERAEAAGGTLAAGMDAGVHTVRADLPLLPR
ncbi:sensor histidine kinase [Actinoplanes awajinensis]|uniref:histidine kinase n=1 Tax=Actinoplanes awajinensis subsp. mycoplanecinus TaxID=135947 RepID=A0A117MNT0_9ACTN|nr:histidine kinase [Actinoplanes awajinensis]KUL27534.1 hypothetical protein ADL15_35135 [Actinoplanes awajinensis subsp. mycoplanecinus]